jgi:hypothetical protein
MVWYTGWNQYTTFFSLAIKYNSLNLKIIPELPLKTVSTTLTVTETYQSEVRGLGLVANWDSRDR